MSEARSELLRPSLDSAPKYKDPFFALVFIVQALIVIGCALSAGIIALTNEKEDHVQVNADGSESAQKVTDQSLVIISGVVIAVFVAAFLSVCWAKAMIHLAAHLITCMLVSVVVILLICSIAFFISGSSVGGVVALLACLASAAWAVYVRPRIAFASTNLKIACSSVLQMSSVMTYALVMLVVQTLWCVIWTMAVLGVVTNDRTSTLKSGGSTYDLSTCTSYQYTHELVLSEGTLQCQAGTCYACVCADQLVKTEATCSHYSVNSGLYFAMLLSLYWTCTVISNIVHCTTSGAVGSWWFHESPGSSPVRDAFVRACTTSLGPICFGSLLVAIIRTLRAMLHTVKKVAREARWGSKVEAFLCICTDAVLQTFEKLLGFFNRYAFCYVAIYSSGFVEAGINVYDLFLDRGWTAIVNDDLIDNALTLGSFVCAAVCGVVTLAFGKSSGLSGSGLVVLCTAGVFIGYVMAMVMLKVVNSAVATVFVLFAESPESFRLTHPQLYEELLQAWSRCHPQMMLKCGYVDAVAIHESESVRGTYTSPSSPKYRDDVQKHSYSVLPAADDLDEGDEATV